MSTVTVESSRFGSLEIEAGAIIEFPAGLIGLGGRRWAVVTKDDNGPFSWLHSLDDPALALPVTNPWEFFTEYEVLLSDADSERFEQSGDVAVWVTVRAGAELTDFSANLRAPILISNGQGFQGSNAAPNAEVRARLDPEAEAEAEAA
jgi:flagellar assembly factor FliW